MIAEPTGTDGFPVLCHQFFPSCLSRRESCLTSSKTFWLKRNKLSEAPLLFSSNGGQDQETQQMVSPLQHGRWCCNVCLKRSNLCEQLQMMMGSPMKQDGVSFVRLVAAQSHV